MTQLKFLRNKTDSEGPWYSCQYTDRYWRTETKFVIKVKKKKEIKIKKKEIKIGKREGKGKKKEKKEE